MNNPISVPSGYGIYLGIEVEKHKWRISPLRLRYHASVSDVNSLPHIEHINFSFTLIPPSIPLLKA